jgi:hypothetical protein
MSNLSMRRSRHRGPTIAPANRPDLAQLLSHLVDRLAEIGDGLEPARPSVPAISRWADSDYVYLETDLPVTDGPEADISIQSGHIFIRIARTTADAAPTIRRGG